MRLDPKFFNLFIGACAVITIIVIVWGTVNYSQNQVREFRENLNEVHIDTLSFKSYSEPDSLFIRQEFGRPIVIHFWSTWSGKSTHINSFLNNYIAGEPELLIIAASVKDAEELIREYMEEQNYGFHYVEGTAFFQKLLVPGVPSMILINREGLLFDAQVGDDIEALETALDSLIHGE